MLEARDRVGGRVWNTEIGGEANELGGQWVAPYQSAMHALLDELEIELFPSFREGEHVYIDPAGKAHRYEGHDAPLGAASERAFAEAEAKLDALAKELDPEAPWAHPDARRARRDHLRGVAAARGRRRDGPGPAALLARGRLPGEAGSHLLAAPGAVDDRRRRWHLRAVRARSVPRLPGRRRLAADPDSARRAPAATASCSTPRRATSAGRTMASRSAAEAATVRARAVIVAVPPNLTERDPLPPRAARLAPAAGAGPLAGQHQQDPRRLRAAVLARGGALGPGVRALRARPRALRQLAAVGDGRRPHHLPGRRERRARRAPERRRSPRRRARGHGEVRRRRGAAAGRLHRDRLVGPGVDAGRLRDELRRRRADAGSARTCAGRSGRSTGPAPTSPVSGTSTWRARSARASGPPRPAWRPYARVD